MAVDKKSRRKRWLIRGGIVLATVAAFFVALELSEPAPPNSVRLATGGPGSAYHAYGKRLAARLQELGLKVELVQTRGSLENYERLTTLQPDRSVHVAFVQSGVRDSVFLSEELLRGRRAAKATGSLPVIDPEALPVRAIATLYSEPLWLFYRKSLRRRLVVKTISQITQLRNQHIAIGPRGSGTQPVARLIFAKNGITSDRELKSLPMGLAIDHLLSGKPLGDGDRLDGMVLIASPRSANVHRLLRAKQLELMDFKRHVAYSKQIRFLSHVELHRGVVDLNRDLPRRSVSMIAPKAMLACRRQLHPRVVELFYKASQLIFSEGNAVDPPGRFPNIKNSELAVHPAAEQFARNGESWLSRSLPFWAVRLLSRLKLLLIPLLTVLIPVFKIWPMIVSFRVKRLMKRHYAALSLAEQTILEATDREGTLVAVARVEGLREELVDLSDRIPHEYRNELYHWRMHLRLVRNDALAQMEREPEPEAPVDSESAIDSESAAEGGEDES
jgi:uncharacterized protein